MADLLPCPFCASEQVTTSPCETITDDDRPEVTWAAMCKVCGARVDHDTEVEAIAAWNRRGGANIDETALAEIIHGAMCRAASEFKGEPKPWQNGNSTAEHYARREARAALASSAPDPIITEMVEALEELVSYAPASRITERAKATLAKVRGKWLLEPTEAMIEAGRDCRKCGGSGWVHENTGPKVPCSLCTVGRPHPKNVARLCNDMLDRLQAAPQEPDDDAEWLRTYAKGVGGTRLQFKHRERLERIATRLQGQVDVSD